MSKSDNSFSELTPDLYDELNANLDTTWPIGSSSGDPRPTSTSWRALVTGRLLRHLISLPVPFCIDCCPSDTMGVLK